MVILTILILAIHESKIPFHLFVSSFFHHCLIVSQVQISNLLRFIPRYFIIFGTVVNGIVFLMSFSDTSLLVHTNTTDFYYINFVSCNFTEFIYELQWLFGGIFRIFCVSANSDSFTSSFPTWIPFISFSCLIDVARISTTC